MNLLLMFAEMLLDLADFLLNFAKFCQIEILAKFAAIPPELGVVSKLVRVKCDLIFDCKDILQ